MKAGLLRSFLRPAAMVAGGVGVKTAHADGLSHQYDESEPYSFANMGTAGQLKAPGQLENWNGEAQRVTHPHTYGGLKLDITKPMTPNFVVRHSTQLGEWASNPNLTEGYSFMAQIFNERGVMMGTIDQSGTLESHMQTMLSPDLMTKVIFYMSNQAQMFWHDLDLSGDSYNAQLRWGHNVMGWQGKMVHLGYTQAVTPALSFGVEACLQNNFMTPTNLVTVKYHKGDETAIATYKSHCQPAAPGDDAAGELNLYYHHQILKDRLNLATSLSVIPLAMQATCQMGAEFKLQNATVHTSYCPSSNKLATTITTKAKNNFNFSFSGEATLGAQNPQTGQKADSYRFGYGISIG